MRRVLLLLIFACGAWADEKHVVDHAYPCGYEIPGGGDLAFVIVLPPDLNGADCRHAQIAVTPAGDTSLALTDFAVAPGPPAYAAGYAEYRGPVPKSLVVRVRAGSREHKAKVAVTQGKRPAGELAALPAMEHARTFGSVPGLRYHRHFHNGTYFEWNVTLPQDLPVDANLEVMPSVGRLTRIEIVRDGLSARIRGRVTLARDGGVPASVALELRASPRGRVVAQVHGWMAIRSVHESFVGERRVEDGDEELIELIEKHARPVDVSQDPPLVDTK